MQKEYLLRALQQIAAKREHVSRVVLWIDQVMGQRYPLSERDWIRNGIFPYFSFDFLALNEQNDPRRCWLFLERLISTTYTNVVEVTDAAHLYEKTNQMGTITPIQEVASKVLLLVAAALLDKEAYNDDDKEQIRRWAATLFKQDSKMAYQELVSGSNWDSRLYDLLAYGTSNQAATGARLKVASTEIADSSYLNDKLCQVKVW